jgi:hypothetical protein
LLETTPATGSARPADRRAAAAHGAWRPGLAPFVVTFSVVLTVSVIVFRPNPTPLGWTLTVVWSLPAYASMVSLQGTLLIRRRYRRRTLMTPPAPADAIRPADDIGRLRALTGLGNPVGGVHGELLLIRASVEASLGWDYGPKAIVEDAQIAMLFSQQYPGRSDWFEGRSYGASPASVRDFIKQRERWAWGLIALCFNRTIPRRYRALLSLSLSLGS